MHVVVILDVTPLEGEARRDSAAVIEELENEIERVAVDVSNASGIYSAHAVKVLGIGKTWPEAQESQTARTQFNSARD